ncbi:MAG: hypothetical protein K9L17_06635 [Clostridiales bacterium]|nr:hypothetical protein [Clostridiales bacterium]MCF8022349.1 hypothetical protein [Clostridiales bacterium]
MIEKGKIINQQDLKIYSYIIRVLDVNDIPGVIDLQDYIMSLMKNKSFCVILSSEEHYEIMSVSGETIGLFIGDKLYAVCSILFPGYREDNMARKLNFSSEELLQVAQLELSMVHPNFRGNDLQRRMADMLARQVKKKKNYRYLFTTVSPYNYPSIKTVTSMGLNITKLCKMYYQWDRYVVYKDIVNPLSLDKNSTINVSSTFFEKQQELLNKEYFGFSQFKDKDGIKIMYAPKMSSCQIIYNEGEME